MKIFIGIFILYHGFQSAMGDHFSSMSDMEQLYEQETKVAAEVQDFVHLLDKQIDALDTFLDTYYVVRFKYKLF